MSSPDPSRSRIVLIGAGKFNSELLGDIPSIGTGLEELRRTLTDPAVGVFDGDEQRCIVIADPRVPQDVYDPFFRAAGQADDVLLVYYAGHGLLDEDRRLHLAVEGSDPRQPVGSAVEFDALKRKLERARARLRIMILDCCYSGYAVGRQSTVAIEDDTAVAMHQVLEVADIDAAGMYVLASSDRLTPSEYRPGEPTTAFTGALLQALHADPDAETTLGQLYPRIAAELRRRRMPAPQTVAGNSSGHMVIRRPGRRPALPEQLATRTPPVESTPRKRIGIVAGAGVAVVAAVAATFIATSGTTASPKEVGPSPTATPAAPASAAEPVALFADDFSGPGLDPAKWQPPASPSHVHQADGHLLLSSRPGEGVDYTKLETAVATGPFTDVRLSVTIPPFARGGQGGASLVLNPTGKQPQILAMGPGSGGGALVAPLTCNRPSCRLAAYADFTEPDFSKMPDLQTGRPVAVEITRSENRLVFLINGVQVGSTEIDPGPLTGLWFAVSAGDEESWDVQVDDLVVA